MIDFLVIAEQKGNFQYARGRINITDAMPGHGGAMQLTEPDFAQHIRLIAGNAAAV